MIITKNTYHLSEENLRGNVKRIWAKEFRYGNSLDNIPEKGDSQFENYESHYNEAGYLIEKADNIHGRVNGYRLYKYNERHQVIESREVDANKKSVRYKSVRIFNDKHQEIEDNNYRKGNKHEYKLAYTYDDLGNVKICEVYFIEKEESRLSSQTVYIYDAHQRAIEKREYNSEKKLRNIHKVVYNEQNFEIERTYFNNEEEVEKTELNTYDTFGNILERKWLNEEGKLNETETYTYDYDQHNNWIKQVYKSVYSFGYTTIKIIEREIEYY